MIKLNYENNHYWTYLAFAMIPLSLLTVGMAVPFLMLFGYLSVQKEQKIGIMKMQIDYLSAYPFIDSMIQSGNIDKEELDRLVNKAEQSNFEQLAYEIGVPSEEINRIIDENVEPYKKSYYKAGVILKE